QTVIKEAAYAGFFYDGTIYSDMSYGYIPETGNCDMHYQRTLSHRTLRHTYVNTRVLLANSFS
mgnify:CR=1